MNETKVKRLRLDDVQGDPMFAEALSIWNQTVAASDAETGASALAQICDPATNLFHSDMNANSVLGFRVKTLRQAFDLRQTRGEEIGNYPDPRYVDAILAPNYTVAAAENTPIFRRIMTPMVGSFAVYEGILLPYFGKDGRTALSLSRLLYLADDVEIAAPVILTERERSCLEFLSSGLSAKQIAHALNTSKRIIEHDIESIKIKIQARNASHAVAKGLFSYGVKAGPPAATPDRTPLRSLTLRERQCLSLLTSGHSAKTIAESLSLSAKTVEKHVNSAKVKLGASKSAELVAKGAAAAVSSLDGN